MIATWLPFIVCFASYAYTTLICFLYLHYLERAISFLFVFICVFFCVNCCFVCLFVNFLWRWIIAISFIPSSLYKYTYHVVPLSIKVQLFSLSYVGCLHVCFAFSILIVTTMTTTVLCCFCYHQLPFPCMLGMLLVRTIFFSLFSSIAQLYVVDDILTLLVVCI